MRARNAISSHYHQSEVVPQQLLEPTYQNRLRVIGRFIDERRLHSVTLLEVPGGFLLRASHDSSPDPVLVEFSDGRLTDLLRAGPKLRGSEPLHRETRALIPTGYEDLLRALGYRLDQRVAENVVIEELSSALVVAGFEAVLDPDSPTSEHFSEPLGPDDAVAIVEEAHARRGTHQEIQTYIPPNFRG